MEDENVSYITALSADSSSNEPLYTAAQLAGLGTLPTVEDPEGTTEDSSTLTNLFDQSGNYVGSYGFDADSGNFAAWVRVRIESHSKVSTLVEPRSSTMSNWPCYRRL